MSNHSLRKVDFDNYDGVIGAINVGHNHWNFLYLHKLNKKVYVVDPMGQAEANDSAEAASRFRQYFNMRQNRYQKTDWVGIKWEPATINYSIQKDGYSCGVFVMKMAEDVVEAFPLVPHTIKIPIL